MDLGLARVQALLRRVGSPHTRFPVIHVAGTNGKGSTTACLDALLTHGAGLRAARYNSPHLVTARDSLRVGSGDPIDTHTWDAAVQRTRHADNVDPHDPAAPPICATPFELLTVQALLAVTMLPLASQPDVLIIEVGVGGRLDATNVFPPENVLASVICPISHDHETLLGAHLGAIAREKAGIIKEQGLCIVSDQCTHPPSTAARAAAQEIAHSLQDAVDRMHARAAVATIPWGAMEQHAAEGDTLQRLSVRVSFAQPLHATGSSVDPACAQTDTHISLASSATLGRLTGCTTALQTLWSIAHDRSPYTDAPLVSACQHVRDRIRTRLFLEGNHAHINAALAHQRWEGRAEWHWLVRNGVRVPLLLDGAHNGASARALRQYLGQCLAACRGNVHITWIMAMSRGKDASSMLDTLLAPYHGAVAAQQLAVVPFSTPVEGMPWVAPVPPSELAALALDGPWTLDGPVRAFPALADALDWAASKETQALHLVVVCGSLYLVSDYYRM
ncbi:dihydrofolate synthase [Malassezia vespertilionis]|uniref:Fol3p n=1 Tax=Malassezia vespertilionis TaxID=2020962 RepID=A0A2N1JE95_9BASI|nr:dihydrofolate synthase [Malassezia vespertilionis]PKI84869.1 Fol3p [Malassezia vespertilionis]WFD06031.1 dihydrofolate synthase [Malassezia vespertilionis]